MCIMFNLLSSRQAAKERLIMKLYMANIGWDYEGGMILGVYDTEMEAKNRIKEYTKDGLYVDRSEVVTLTLNTNEEIDL